MSTSNAEMYGRRARDAQDFKEVGNNVRGQQVEKDERTNEPS
jgi:hypothetical protein